MLGTIFLDITTGSKRSIASLRLNKEDIQALYDREFATVCPICRGTMGDSAGNVCCRCFKLESRNHADCCLAEVE